MLMHIHHSGWRELGLPSSLLEKMPFTLIRICKSVFRLLVVINVLRTACDHSDGLPLEKDLEHFSQVTGFSEV